MIWRISVDFLFVVCQTSYNGADLFWKRNIATRTPLRNDSMINECTYYDLVITYMMDDNKRMTTMIMP